MIDAETGELLTAHTIGGDDKLAARSDTPAAKINQVKAPELVTLSVSPSEILDYNPKRGGIVGEISWDAAAGGYESVDILLVGANGDESTFSAGTPVGKKVTRAWLRPGLEIRMIDVETGDLLTACTIGGDVKLAGRSDTPAAKINQVKAPDRVMLSVLPAEIPDYDPKRGGIVGEISWDAAAGGYESVEIVLANANGVMATFSSGAPVGKKATKAWLRPGLEIRLSDSETGELLATRTISG
jgi:hypothetical protein